MSKKNSRSIFRVLLVPLLGVLTVQILLLMGTLILGGVFERLNQNARDILQKQVENRAGYLLNEMNGSWSQLEGMAEQINQKVWERLEEGQISRRGLCANSEEYTLVLNDISSQLIETMYNKQVSGIFVILCTEESGAETAGGDLPGIYFRDLDPLAVSSAQREDILVERAPRAVIQEGALATDQSWQPLFAAADSWEKEYFSKPYAAAAEASAEERLEAKDFGYWTSSTYCLTGDDRTAISYSIPLILEDGTVYGVLGVELLTEYIESLLPETELHQEKGGAYILAVAKSGSSELKPLILSGNGLELTELLQQPFVLSEDKQSVQQKEKQYYATVQNLKLYSRNAPFEEEEWYLLGGMPRKQLFAFSSQLRLYIGIAVIVVLLVGFLGILMVSSRISDSIAGLSREVEEAQKKKKIPVLSSIHIFEIDQLVDSITLLGREVLATSSRFLNIINMSSVELAGYELKNDGELVYVSDNYFELLGMEQVKTQELTAGEFIAYQREIEAALEHSAEEDGSVIYTVSDGDGSERYLRAVERKVGNRYIGLVEDVTFSVLEKKKIERDRDYDVLTGLLGRQGFGRASEKLFRQKEQLKTAALVMMDLDNLKVMNDTYGHSTGDAYIKAASECFRRNVPAKSLCARISGDEFIILIYGYDDRETIWQYIKELYRQIKRTSFVLPSGVDKGLSASGGVAWYPKDSTNVSDLMRFADFAMYCVKKREKGNVSEFDETSYQEMLYRNQRQQEFYQVLEMKQLTYHFQPIFDSRTGRIYSYEALMRVNAPNLKSPMDVLQIAKETERMQDIETLTFFKAAETFEKLLEENKLEKDALLFINSIADVCMSEENVNKFSESFGSLREYIVIEITETENLDMELVRKKQSMKGVSGLLALDDYGSGYNTEINLLELNPKYIKVDIAIVRNIHQDENKQQLMKNIVEYAHKRDMLILAEGLEYPEELEKCLELGVDLLQGYFLAKPAAVPSSISEEAYRIIEAFGAEKHQDE